MTPIRYCPAPWSALSGFPSGLTDPGLRIVDIRGYVKTEDLGGGRQHAEYVGARDEYDAGTHSRLGLRRLDGRHRRPGPRGQSAARPGRAVRGRQ